MIEETLIEFKNKIYGKVYSAGNALFDREGNNMSQAVENFLIEKLKEVEIKKVEKIVRIIKTVGATGTEEEVDKLIELINNI